MPFTLDSDGQWEAEQIQSTLPAWGATRTSARWFPDAQHFNPRSPRGERLDHRIFCRAGYAISIHAPRVGSDDLLLRLEGQLIISIHAPRVGSDLLHNALRQVVVISIHAPRVGSDGLRVLMVIPPAVEFQSTLPAWGAT